MICSMIIRTGGLINIAGKINARVFTDADRFHVQVLFPRVNYLKVERWYS